jgi:catechol 2,3-dioxygenase-like lactoylglutathione lyase family enzyme
MPTLNGILETALYVADVRRAAEFYRRLFGFDVLLESDRLVALDVVGRNVLLLFKQGATDGPYELPAGAGTGVIPGHRGVGGGHFAFAIDADQVEPWKQHLRSHGVPIESTVTWPGGAVSIYVRDPDQNVAELITPGFWRTY